MATVPDHRTTDVESSVEYRSDHNHVEVRSPDGTVCGWVAIDPVGKVATLRFQVNAGRASGRACAQVLGAIFDLPELNGCRTVRAALPLGNFELVSGLGDRLRDVRTRAAGTTCLLDAALAS